MSDEDEITLGEVARSVKRIEGTLTKLYSDAVLRSEFEARLTAHDRAINDLKGSKPQWTAVAAVVVSAMALLVVLVPVIANG